MTQKLKTLRIFISSPGDVAEERALTRRVIQRLQGEFAGRVALKPIYWEHEPLLATETFQKQIIRPSKTDIVICILWSRLGTRLPSQFTRSDGSRYSSGTEFEFEDAMSSYRQKGKPDLLIYRKMTDPVVSLKDKQILLDRLRQREALDTFFKKWFHDEAEGTLIAAFHSFDTSADFEELLEVHLHKLIERQQPESIPSEEIEIGHAMWQQGSPYRGLNVFHFDHAPIFFGRTKAIADVLNALRVQAESGRAFVLVLGMSGGGKSSLVRAGVLPMLTQPGVIESVGLWRRSIMRPSDSSGDLFDGLAAALLRKEALPKLSADCTDVNELAELLRETPKAVVPLIKSGLFQAAVEFARNEKLTNQPPARLVLVVDQMEEIFTLERITHEERVAFIDTLDVLARSGRVWIISTLRSDFYPKCTELKTLVVLKEKAGQYDLLPPTPAEIGQMIRQPAQAAGLRFEEDPATNERLDEALRDAASRNPGVLALLEFTLEELYKQRTDKGILTYEAYKKLGGVEGALAQRAEEVYTGLEPKVQSAFGTVLHALVSIGQAEEETITRKYAPLDAVTATPETKALVEVFVKARLFITDLDDNGNAVVSVAHEALLQHWPRLREWLEKNKEDLRVRSRVTTAASRWDEESKSRDFLLTVGKPLAEAEELLKSRSIDFSEMEKNLIKASIAKRHRVRWMKRIVVAMLAVLTVIAAGLAYFADKQRERVEIESKTSKQVSDFLVNLFEVSDPSEARGNTITAREILDRGTDKIEEELKDQPGIQATLMTTMGNVYRSLGLYDNAASLLKSALDTKRQIYGNEHLEVASNLNQLAVLHYCRGDYEIAEQLYREALSIYQKLLGNEHEDIAVILNNLAATLYEKGDLEASEPMQREALAMHRKLFGNDHPDISSILFNLARCLEERGEYDEAEKLFQQALELDRKNFGEDHPDVAFSLGKLAYLLELKGENEEAEKLYREELSIYRKVLGDEHPYVAIGLGKVARIFYNKGDFETAEQLYREVLAIQQKSLPVDDWRIAIHMYNLSYCLTMLKRYQEAEPLSLKSYQILKIKRGENDVHTVASLNCIIELYEAWNKPNKAAKYRTMLPVL